MTVRIGLIMGDPSGIGPELCAKLLSEPSRREGAGVLLIGDEWVWSRGNEVAGTRVEAAPVSEVSSLRLEPGTLTLWDIHCADPGAIRPGTATAAGGHAALEALSKGIDLAQRHMVDALVFAPLNKQGLHLADMGFEDELQWFAHKLAHRGLSGEINVLSDLWTTRVTSHVPLREVADLITPERVLDAIGLAHGALVQAGRKQPRIGVAALNPHGGDGGIFGREEIDIIEPAVRQAVTQGMDAAGPYPSDTVFLRAKNGDFDAVVTMYHDQGQIAMKLMGFDAGVTVAGGLPVPITTPAHGTAFDIVGQGIASTNAIARAFEIACAMGEA